MLRLALFFFLVAIIAGLFGFTDIAGAASNIAQVIFGVFLILFLGAMFLGLFVAKQVVD